MFSNRQQADSEKGGHGGGPLDPEDVRKSVTWSSFEFAAGSDDFFLHPALLAEGE